MNAMTLLNSCCPLLLRLSILLDLLLLHLLVMLHHLGPHVSIRIDILFSIPINSWPATTSSFSGHFSLTVIFKSNWSSSTNITMRINILDSKERTTWIVFLMAQGTIWIDMLWYQIVTPISNVTRIFNMCVKTDTGYINHRIRKYNISWDSEYIAVSSHMSI